MRNHTELTGRVGESVDVVDLLERNGDGKSQGTGVAGSRCRGEY